MQPIIRGPWSWRPDPRAWFDTLGPKIDAWDPDPNVIPDPQPIRVWLHDCASRGTDALMHPCITALTDPAARGRAQRDIQLAVWAATLVAEPCGELRVPSKLSSRASQLWLWSADGGTQVDPGPHALADLARATRDATTTVPVALDVWCHCVGHVLRDSWAEIDELTQSDVDILQREVGFFVNALQWVATTAPQILTWITAVTRVVVPLRRQTGPEPLFHSGSSPELPGLIHCDLFAGEMQILEALVRESAHRHVYIAEASGDLVDPACVERFVSPLRPEPRPLRAVILVCHALAYICLMYRHAIQAGLVASTRVERDFAQLRRGLHESSATIEAARDRLTDHGAQFVGTLLEVAHA